MVWIRVGAEEQFHGLGPFVPARQTQGRPDAIAGGGVGRCTIRQEPLELRKIVDVDSIDKLVPVCDKPTSVSGPLILGRGY